MPRKARKILIAPQTMYHIVCRGVHQCCIFWNKRDNRKYLEILSEAKKKNDFFLYSYNLLPNHLHLLMETKNIPISKIMHYINTLYAIYFNKRWKRVGHLFQDRFYSSLVDKESYFWAVSAYIDLNAVRAGLVEKPEDYPWSSYQFYAKKDYSGGLIDRERFIRYGGNGPIEKLRQDYLNFVKEEAKSPKKPKFIKTDKFI